MTLMRQIGWLLTAVLVLALAGAVGVNVHAARETLAAQLRVKNADNAVPTMPMPNTPLAKPRRDGSYQALENGTPTAKIVPATPR